MHNRMAKLQPFGRFQKLGCDALPIRCPWKQKWVAGTRPSSIDSIVRPQANTLWAAKLPAGRPVAFCY